MQKNNPARTSLIATLNVRGRTTSQLGPGQTSKWPSINKLIREEKISIMCIQETHLTPENETQIDNLFSRRLCILNSSDPTRPGNSAGVAFILNKEKLNIDNTKMTILIPGRAISLSLKWHNDHKINILNIYAPNNPQEHPTFWEKIKTAWRHNNLGQIDFMAGDFNITEDPLDRAPARQDNIPAIEALRDFRLEFNIQDNWRHTHPNTCLFTFNSNTDSMSRLDRIYTSSTHQESMSNWKSYLCSVPTDHNIVTVHFAPPGLPHIGKGRWSWPLGVTLDRKLLEKIETLGIELQTDLINNTDQNRIVENNPQLLWETFKQKMNQIAKDTAKSHLAKINCKIKQLRKDITDSSN
ncbi:Endonuclease/exonuclease/phosphatase, partial [Suillus occidentalis]